MLLLPRSLLVGSDAGAFALYVLGAVPQLIFVCHLVFWHLVVCTCAAALLNATQLFCC